MRRLRAVFEDLERVVPEERKAAISRELALLAEALKRTFPDAVDQERASEPHINTLLPSGPHRVVKKNVAPGSGLAVATTAALAGAFVALDPQAVQSWG